MNKTISAKTGHTLFIRSAERSELPADLPYKEHYTRFYVVKNWDENGPTFFYLAKGHKEAPGQIVGWYSKGSFYSGYGSNVEEIIDRMQKDGWMYA